MFDSRYQTIFLIGFAAYMSIQIFIGFLASRKKNEGEDFLTGGRKIPLALVFATVGATLVGTNSSIGVISNAFQRGYAVMIFVFGGLIGLLSMRIFISARDKNFLTMSEEAQYYFGGNRAIRYVMGCIMFLVEIAWLGNHINGGGIYLSYVTGMNFTLAKLVILVAFSIYIFIGGYLAVVWTDTIQYSLLLVGFAIIAVSAVPYAGGMSAINAAFSARAAANAGAPSAGPSVIIQVLALTTATTMGIIGTPTHRTRIYTAKDAKTARRAFTMNAVLLSAYGILPVLIGMSAYTIATANNATAILERPDFAFAYMATTVLGPMFGLFLLVAGMASTISAGDSDALAGVTILVTDIYPAVTKRQIAKKDYVKYSRVFLVVVIALSFLMTLMARDIISYITRVIGALIPGIAVTMLLGKLMKRATWQGGLAAVLSGTVFGFIYLFVPPVSDAVTMVIGGPAIPAAIISLVSGIGVSLFTPRNTVSEEDALAAVIACRRTD